MAEPGVGKCQPDTHYQFERLGYFFPDPDGTAEKPVFNRTVTLRDTWSKQKSR